MVNIKKITSKLVLANMKHFNIKKSNHHIEIEEPNFNSLLKPHAILTSVLIKHKKKDDIYILFDIVIPVPYSHSRKEALKYLSKTYEKQYLYSLIDVLVKDKMIEFYSQKNNGYRGEVNGRS